MTLPTLEVVDEIGWVTRIGPFRPREEHIPDNNLKLYIDGNKALFWMRADPRDAGQGLLSTATKLRYRPRGGGVGFFEYLMTVRFIGIRHIVGAYPRTRYEFQIIEHTERDQL